MNIWASGIVGLFGAVLACGSSGSGSGEVCVDGVCESTGATGCDALSACCPNLPVAEDPAACYTVAGSGTATACSQSVATYQEAGYCKAVAVPSEGLASPCAALASCCSSTTIPASDVSACNYGVSVGDANSCTEILAEFCGSGYVVPGMGSTGSGGSSTVEVPGLGTNSTTCEALAQCCPSLPSSETASCQEIASDGTSQACSAALSEFQASGGC